MPVEQNVEEWVVLMSNAKMMILDDV